MAKKSITSRFKVTKTGKVIRRSMGQSHFKTKKNGAQIRNKRRTVLVLGAELKMLKKKYLNIL